VHPTVDISGEVRPRILARTGSSLLPVSPGFPSGMTILDHPGFPVAQGSQLSREVETA
jgi:hypothetical protein